MATAYLLQAPMDGRLSKGMAYKEHNPGPDEQRTGPSSNGRAVHTLPGRWPAAPRVARARRRCRARPPASDGGTRLPRSAHVGSSLSIWSTRSKGGLGLHQRYSLLAVNERHLCALSPSFTTAGCLPACWWEKGSPMIMSF